MPTSPRRDLHHKEGTAILDLPRPAPGEALRRALGRRLAPHEMLALETLTQGFQWLPFEWDSELQQVVLAEDGQPLTEGQLDLLLRAAEALTDAWVAGEPEALAVPLSPGVREEQATLRYPFLDDPEGRHHLDPQAVSRFAKAAQSDPAHRVKVERYPDGQVVYVTITFRSELEYARSKGHLDLLYHALQQSRPFRGNRL